MSSMYNDASLALIPSAVGDGVVYNARPVEVLGAELVTNGDFATDSDWTKGTGWTIGSGVATSDGTTSNLDQSSVLTTGASYKATITVSSMTVGALSFRLGSNPSDEAINITSNGTYTFYGDAGDTTLRLRSQSSFNGSIDNVSVKETSAQDFDFTRASEATRVLSGGRIEKGRENLLLQSNTFSNAVWAGASTTETSGQSGYDGTNNAWLLEKLVANGNISQSVSASNLLTYSVYAKAGTRDWLRLNIVGVANAYFDLANGVVGSTSGSAAITSAMVDAGGGWYRCSFTYNVASTTGVSIYVADADNDSSGTSGNIYIQNAQLEQGLAATEYIATTTTSVSVGSVNDMPRLDWSGGCPALLLEPLRTNGFPHSEYLGSWSANRLDRTANNLDSPEGIQNAYKMAQQNGFTTAGNINYAGITAGTKTLSIFAKAGTFDHIALSYNGVTYFNLTNGTIGTTASGHTAVITDMGDGWYRCAITKTTTGVYTSAYYFAQNNGTLTTTDTQGYMYAYGAMLETGSYETSYIPSYGTATTRAVDACYKTGITSLIGQTEGTIFIDINNRVVSPYPNEYVFRLTGTGSNQLWLRKESGGSNFTARLIVGGSNVWTISIVPNNGLTKIALAYKSGDSVIYLNGAQVNTSSATFSGNVLEDFYFGFTSSGNTEVKVNQALLFTTRLSDTELEKLTTL